MNIYSCDVSLGVGHFALIDSEVMFIIGLVKELQKYKFYSYLYYPYNILR